MPHHQQSGVSGPSSPRRGCSRWWGQLVFQQPGATRAKPPGTASLLCWTHPLLNPRQSASPGAPGAWQLLERGGSEQCPMAACGRRPPRRGRPQRPAKHPARRLWQSASCCTGGKAGCVCAPMPKRRGRARCGDPLLCPWDGRGWCGRVGAWGRAYLKTCCGARGCAPHLIPRSHLSRLECRCQWGLGVLPGRPLTHPPLPPAFEPTMGGCGHALRRRTPPLSLWRSGSSQRRLARRFLGNKLWRARGGGRIRAWF